MPWGGGGAENGIRKGPLRTPIPRKNLNAAFSFKKKNWVLNRIALHTEASLRFVVRTLVLVGITNQTARPLLFFFFFFNDTATTEIYTLSLHDALPICRVRRWCVLCGGCRRHAAGVRCG